MLSGWLVEPDHLGTVQDDSSRTINRPWTSSLVVPVVTYIWGLIYTIYINYIVISGDLDFLLGYLWLLQPFLETVLLGPYQQEMQHLEEQQLLDLQACVPAAATAAEGGREGGAAPAGSAAARKRGRTGRDGGGGDAELYGGGCCS